MTKATAKTATKSNVNVSAAILKLVASKPGFYRRSNLPAMLKMERAVVSKTVSQLWKASKIRKNRKGGSYRGGYILAKVASA